ncbi:class I SAM-dependent methyltransferase [Tepidibacter hydrothermalis]|uniref:Class I SAM-dependent methyltransferase n=1 Tax=Tepidibacter hydrothermalis TaxID=3036126 RepID=A0ABY8EDV6_9FIRM|nr:class I SAM-dependent methyltransferase [Tepidibacter hydrothermalis]WFD11133.1 class I SAM-dependent methyltransferase [Tepidibacter hydrothermalis]
MDNLINNWNEINSQKKVWDNIVAEDNKFYYELEGEKIFLSSFEDNDLPKSQYELTALGDMLTKLSSCANIMCKRPGTEEVTFYCHLSQPHGGWLNKVVDKKMLEKVAPPINWRRDVVIEFVNNAVHNYVFNIKEGFAAIDIGCGGGFDSLEVERIMRGIHSDLDYKIVNVDIDEKWLKNNENLSLKMFGKDTNISRYNMSVFDYFDEKNYKNDFENFDNLIVLCNGFAEFFDDDNLTKLYKGIYELTKGFKGKIDIVLPFSVKDEKQEKIGHRIGFKYRTKSREYMLDLVKDIFEEFEVDFEEKHSQIVLKLKK